MKHPPPFLRHKLYKPSRKDIWGGENELYKDYDHINSNTINGEFCHVVRNRL
jgi:hypothetical protein